MFSLSEKSHNLSVIIAVTLVALRLHEKFIKQDKMLLDQTKNKIFDIITNNCSSSGVNKMQIVDEIGLIIDAERKASKTKIANLEAKLGEIRNLINKNA